MIRNMAKKQLAARCADEARGELERQVRLDGDGDDDPDGGDGHGNFRGLARAAAHHFAPIGDAQPTPSAKIGDHGARRRADDGGVCGRKARDQHGDQHQRRQEQIEPSRDGVFGRQFARTERERALGPRAQVDEDENRGVERERGDESGRGDARVGYLQQLRHHERGDAHDGRHELPACGSDGLHRARVRRAVAGLSHERDGEDARRRPRSPRRCR